jgi:ribosome biogenesis GTPase / thiamine phosphate phosphatase
MKEEDLGYNNFFESNRNKLGLGDFSVARVIAEYRGAYKVKDADGDYLAKVTGKQMFKALSREDYPAVGDWVAITKPDEENAVIQAVLPRQTIMKRKYSNKNETQIIATNIDVAFVIESVDRDYNLNRFERYFAIAKDGGIKPAIILNKIDLISEEELQIKLEQIKNRLSNVDVIATSVIINEGLDNLKSYIDKSKTYCFLGSSGVGKSSLINKLLGKDVIKTEIISTYSDRGKHATTSRQMYFLKDGGIVIDNPGMREVGMTDISFGINNLFDEISALGKKCKYVDCTHTNEPGCEVLSALKAGKIDEDKYLNYINLKKESEYYEMTEMDKRGKDRQFGKFIKKAKKQLKDYGIKN